MTRRSARIQQTSSPLDLASPRLRLHTPLAHPWRSSCSSPGAGFSARTAPGHGPWPERKAHMRDRACAGTEQYNQGAAAVWYRDNGRVYRQHPLGRILSRDIPGCRRVPCASNGLRDLLPADAAPPRPAPVCPSVEVISHGCLQAKARQWCDPSGRTFVRLYVLVLFEGVFDFFAGLLQIGFDLVAFAFGL